LELPTGVERDEEASTPTYGKFVVEPFERGFGTTVGNSLRRILLSSLDGAAVTHVRLKGAGHEFTTLPGVLEDVTEIVLNVKSLIVRLETDRPKTMRVSVSGTKGKTTEVRADRIEVDSAIKIVSKDQLLATLTEDVEFDMEMTVGRGRSYVTADEHKEETEEPVIGVIPVDSVYSPVTRVRYRVEDTRVGQRTNYDRLVLEIWTNGTVTPEMALVEAAKILRKHLNPFVQYFTLGAGLALGGREVDSAVGAERSDQSLDAKLALPISSLDLSVRAGNCLASADITTVGDLVQWEEAQLLRLRSFGKTSLREIKRKLADIGLSLRSDAEHPSDDAGALSVEFGAHSVPTPSAPPVVPFGEPALGSGGLGSAPVSPPPPPEEPPSAAEDSAAGNEVSLAGDNAGESRTNEGVQSV
jgi:DNA-directed RNA polymerase subunit alpha